MEQLKGFIDFITSYPKWTQYTIITLIAVILLLLIFFRPSKDIYSNFSWQLRVYNFNNYGESAENEKIGERFSEMILQALLQNEINAIKGDREQIEIIPGRSGENAFLKREYQYLAPLIMITGSVIDSGDKFTAYVRVTSINRSASLRLLMASGYKVEKKINKMESVADIATKQIIASLEKFQRNQSADKKSNGHIIGK